MNPPRTRSRGFTLIELLTVIGIIIVLVSILLPTVGKVRIAGATASTQQQIATIGGAIERYRMEQGGYPGLLPNSEYDSTTGIARVRPGSTNMTMTESLVLALCGGLTISTTSSEIVYNADLVGRGATSLGPDPARRKRYPAYIDPTPGQMMPDQPWSNTGKVASGDSEIPEFMDRFQVSRPILYLRALKGAPGVVPDYSPGVGGGTYEAFPPSTNAATAQYHPVLLKPYDFLTDQNRAEFEADYPEVPPPAMSPKLPKGFANYFNNPAQPLQARGKDAFLLISAGPDEKYGTRDDIFYPS